MKLSFGYRPDLSNGPLPSPSPSPLDLRSVRKGCVVLVDYTKYTNVDINKIPETRVHYDPIVNAIVDEVVVFNKKGFLPANIYFFGFGYGAQVALGVGRSVSGKIGGKVSRVDVCEPTNQIIFPLTPDSKLSANYVQCIHTNSIMFGTTKRDCHQDWNMGDCGNYQAIRENVTSHFLCPTYYNSAFSNNFAATTMPTGCVAPTTLGVYPTGFKMGYTETRTATGEFYAKTSLFYPYT